LNAACPRTGRRAWACRSPNRADRELDDQTRDRGREEDREPLHSSLRSASSRDQREQGEQSRERERRPEPARQRRLRASSRGRPGPAARSRRCARPRSSNGLPRSAPRPSARSAARPERERDRHLLPDRDVLRRGSPSSRRAAHARPPGRASREERATRASPRTSRRAWPRP
jgi:hypothetical protein